MWRGKKGGYIVAGFEHATPEQLKAIREDYLTGKYDTEMLAQKHKMRRKLVSWHVVRTFKPELDRLGIVPPKEPPLFIDKRPKGFWDRVQIEFLQGGVSRAELCRRYGISASVLAQKLHRSSLDDEKNKMVLAARNKIEKGMLMKASELESRISVFMDKSTAHLQTLLDDLEGYRDPDKPLTIDQFSTMVKSFEKIVSTMRMVCGGDLTKSIVDKGEEDRPRNTIDLKVMSEAKVLSPYADAPIMDIK